MIRGLSVFQCVSSLFVPEILDAPRTSLAAVVHNNADLIRYFA